jgi:hypothetical protein
MTLHRRRMLALAAAALAAPPAFAHHGWRWTDDGRFEVSGIITAARLGNPHGVLSVDAEGEAWQIEVGQPWRNARAGLADDMLRPGVEIVALGRRHADPAQRIVKAERLTIAGRRYDLYPDRL